MFILVDDWGWANAGFHRTDNSSEAVTPNIDALAHGGMILDRHYVFKYCSPTRCALQTGRNPTHVNVLNSPIIQHNPADPIAGFQGAAVNFTGIAEKLKGVGYSTHMVGKWNAGMAHQRQSPAGRGYDSSLFYYDYDTFFWNGTMGACGTTAITDLSMSEGSKARTVPAHGLNNTWDCSQANESPEACPHGYQDDLFFQHVEQVLANASANPDVPFFLFWAPHAPHDPYEVPEEVLDKFANITQRERRFYSAMVNYLDTNFGKLEATLRANGLWDNLLAVVSSDNGGPVGDPYGGNNWPLRGGKGSNFEGGVRANAFAFGGALDPSLAGTVQEGLIGIEDWWTTFALLGGADTTDASAAAAGLPGVDGLDMRGLFLPGGNRTSPREFIVLGSSNASIDTGHTNVEGVIRKDGFKLLLGRGIPVNFWQGPVYPNASGYPNPKALDCRTGCLWNVFDDPHEINEISGSHPKIVSELTTVIGDLSKRVFSPDRGGDDGLACSAAARNGGFWSSFLD